MQTNELRIRFKGISKRFPGVQALDQISFGVERGCVHALVGENGAGKSTLAKIISGAHQVDEGSIELDGKPVSIRDARQAQALGIAIVYQEFNLIPHLSVSENVFLGRWPRSRWSGMIQLQELHDGTRRLLDDLELSVPVEVTVGSLSVAQQQLVEIAKALSLEARVLILDEPSAILTPHELTALFRLMRRLTENGVSIIYISHRMDEIFALADHVTVLRDGRHISTKPVCAVDRESLIHETVGRSLDQEFPARKYCHGPVVLHVEDLSVNGAFKGVSFNISEGEVFALTGLVGSGRSSVAKAIFGALRCSAGRVVANDHRGPFPSPRAAMSAGIAMLPEDRKREGLLLDRPLRENITLAHRDDVATLGFMGLRREQQVATDLMAQHDVRAATTEVAAATLVGEINKR